MPDILVSTMAKESRTQIFAGLDEQYQKYRPRYPAAILDSILACIREGRNDAWPARPLLIDMGAGTGILTRQLAARFGTDFRYIAVEPGDSMRQRAVAETDLQLGIEFVDGTAEAIPASSKSAALVIAAQAAHWFDRPRFYAEAARVLLPGGTLALLYNDRDWRRSGLLAAYEDFLESKNSEYRRTYRAAGLTRAGSGIQALRAGAFESELRALDQFHGFTSANVEWQRTMTADEFIGMCLSTVQFRRALGDLDEPAGAAILREMIESHCEDRARIVVPYMTTLLMVRRASP